MNEFPRIATISAITASIGPAREALLAELPAADVWTLLDDRLLQDADAHGGLTAELSERMVRLIAHARAGGADAVMLTCSLYGPVADALAQSDIPVVSADGPAFDAVAELNGKRVAVVSGGRTPLEDSIARIHSRIEAVGSDVTLVPVLAEDAIQRSQAELEPLVHILREAIEAQAPAVDAVFLSQYSLSPASERLAALLEVPVLSGPQWAARRVADALQHSDRPA